MIRPAMRARRSDRGLTLLEITVAFGIIIIALLGIMSALIQAMRTDEATAEQVRAMNACRSTIEQMKQVAFAEIYARFNSNPADDPGGAGTAAGKNFAVQGLRPLAGDADGLPGEIFFPELAGAVCETVVDTRLGMPAAKDLNGDNDAIDVNVSTTYIILPVRIVIDWQGARGPAHFEMTTYLNP
jgi:type II secretory pathway pseudopilin PulG